MSATRSITDNPGIFIDALDWHLPNLKVNAAGAIEELDADRRAVISLYSGNSADHFGGVKVEIVSKTTGHITAQVFLFDDYLDTSPRGRADDRSGNYPYGGNRTYTVISYIGWRWYIAVPRDDRPFTAAVEDYIDSWR